MKVIQAPFLKTHQLKRYTTFVVKRLKLKSIFHCIASSEFKIELGYVVLVRVFVSFNIAHTLLGDVFKEWVASKISNREQYIINKKLITLNLLPEFSETIALSKNVSGIQILRSITGVLHKRSHFLLRKSDRKRKKSEESKQIEDIENESAVREGELVVKINTLKER